MNKKSQRLALKAKELELLKAKRDYIENNRLWLFHGYDWQQELWRAGIANKQRLLMAGNQVGKTSASCIELCYHLTGRYPANWPGYRFDAPINAWALGVSAEQIKKVLQHKILGDIGDDGCFQGGLIPTSYINYSSIVRGQLKNSIKEIKIRHGKHKWSTLSFLSYEQGQHVLMGAVVDFALIDEEPRDPAIYPQVLTRTLNGDHGRGGHVLLSFTPENGMTELVYQFTNALQPSQYLVQVTWDDAPHLDDDKKEKMLAAYPEHQREMRSKGIPQLGSGAVYPIPDERIYDDATEMLPHWRYINAIDFGYQHCALIWCAYDADSDVLHVYDAIKTTQVLPVELAVIMRSKGEWIPWSYPHDGHLPDRGSGLQQKLLYEKEGVKMIHEHARFDDGNTSREAGITRILQRMKTHKLRVAPHLTEFFKEKRLYHRKNGQVVKTNDHILDALRYAEMMLRYAVTQAESQGEILKPQYLAPAYRR